VATIKSVQSGTVTIADNSASNTATITSVTTANSFLMFTVRHNNASVRDTRDTKVRGVLTNSTTVTFDRDDAASGQGTCVLSWFVIEYTSGVTVQRGTVAGINATTHNVTITAVTLAQSWPIVSQQGVTSYDYGYADTVQAEITTTTNLALTVAGNASTHDFAWQVIDYTGASVQKITKALANTGTSQTSTITSVTTTQTFLQGSYYQATIATIYAGQWWTAYLSDVSTITYTCYENQGKDANAITYVISSSEFGVTRYQTSLTNVQTSKTQSVSPAISDTTKTFLKIGSLHHQSWMRTTENPFDGYMRKVQFNGIITNTTTLTFERGESGFAGDVYSELVQITAGAAASPTFNAILFGFNY